MKYDYTAVDTHAISLKGLIKAMDENAQHIAGLAKGLRAEFTGAGADGYEHITNALNRKLADYQASMTNLHWAIDHTSGSSGLMKQTDVHQGNRFLNIKV